MGLSAHVKTKYVEEPEVRAVPMPEWTQTWHPVSHGQLLDALDRAVSINTRLAIKTKQYSLNQSGMQLFGVWDLDLDIVGRAWSIGFRNSLDKSLSIGLCGGQRVFVCDNLAFNGTFIEFRKHTAGLEFENLVEICQGALDQAQTDGLEFISWAISLKEHELDAESLSWLTVASMQENALAPSKFTHFLDCLYEEYHLEHEMTLYTFHAAVTRAMKGESLFKIAQRNEGLNRVIRKFLEKERNIYTSVGMAIQGLLPWVMPKGGLVNATV